MSEPAASPEPAREPLVRDLPGIAGWIQSVLRSRDGRMSIGHLTELIAIEAVQPKSTVHAEVLHLHAMGVVTYGADGYVTLRTSTPAGGSGPDPAPAVEIPEPARCTSKYDIDGVWDGEVGAHCDNREPGHTRHTNKRYGVEWTDRTASPAPERAADTGEAAPSWADKMADASLSAMQNNGRPAAACPLCGPGYRYGDDGCQHSPAPASPGTPEVDDSKMMRAIAENARALALRSQQRGSRVQLNPLDVIALANAVLTAEGTAAGDYRIADAAEQPVTARFRRRVEAAEDRAERTQANRDAAKIRLNADDAREILAALAARDDEVAKLHARAVAAEELAEGVETDLAARDGEVRQLRAQLARAATMCARPSGTCMDKTGLL